jgi:hypothetical protein
MTEAEWLACADPKVMLEFLRGKVSDRKLRLFAVACCHHVWHLMPDDRCRFAVEVAERFADGIVTEQELRVVADAAFDSAHDNSVATGVQSFDVGQGIYYAARTASYAANSDAYEAAVSSARTIYVASVGAAGNPDVNMAARMVASDAVYLYRRKLVNDIFGNPFRPPPTIDPAWLTWNDGAIVKFAQEIYDQRAFERMAELAEMLEKAGCKDKDMLEHCRQGEAHVRGCWVVDLLLGKE